MTKKNQIPKDDAEYFARQTYKEVTIWDWLGRVLPLTALAIIAVFYFFRWENGLQFVLDVIVVVFFVICFIWWYWAIYKIAVTAKYLKSSQEKFKQVLHELRQFKKEVRHNDSSSDRER